MYTLPDAIRLKNHILGRWEAADKDSALVDDGALTVVVVGGGPTGVETAGAIAELYRDNFVKDYPSLPQEKARIVLVEAGEEIFAMFKPNLREYARDGAREADRRGHDGRPGAVRLPHPRHARLRGGDSRAHARVGRGAAGQQPRAVARDRARARQPHRGRAGSRAPRLSGGVRRRRHRSDHGLEDRAGAPAARLGGTAVGRARGRDHRPPRRRQVDEAVRLPRQGNHGRDRAQCGRRADARREDDEGAGRRRPRGAPCTSRSSRRTRTGRRRSSTGPGAS